jgi:hypothetical protein
MYERSGDKLRAGIDDLKRILTKKRDYPHLANPAQWGEEDLSKLTWMDGIFGDTESGRINRDTLVKLNLTNGGMGYYSQQIHNSADRIMKYFRDVAGWDEAKIFNHMTKGKRGYEIYGDSNDTDDTEGDPTDTYDAASYA